MVCGNIQKLKMISEGSSTRYGKILKRKSQKLTLEEDGPPNAFEYFYVHKRKYCEQHKRADRCYRRPNEKVTS